MPDNTEQTARDILSRRRYSWIFVPEEEGGFSAKILELPGCFAEGDTIEEARQNLEEAALNWIQDQTDKGEPIPAPQPSQGHSGRFLLRLPRSLHARAAQVAATENVSLNQFISNAVAEKVAITTMAPPLAQVVQTPMTIFIDPSAATALVGQLSGMPNPFRGAGLIRWSSRSHACDVLRYEAAGQFAGSLE